MGEIHDAPEWLTATLETTVVAGLSLIPGAGGPLAVVADRVFQRMKENVAEAGEAALREAGDAETLLRAISNDERLSSLFGIVTERAARSALRAKRRALGTMLGRSAKDQTKIDETELMIHALSDLEAPHIRALRDLRESTRDLDDAAAHEASSDVFSRYPEPVRAALERHGTLHAIPAYEGHPLIAGVNDFGKTLLNYLEEPGKTISRPIDPSANRTVVASGLSPKRTP